LNLAWTIALAACLLEATYAAILGNWLIFGLMIALSINATFQLLMFRKRP